MGSYLSGFRWDSPVPAVLVELTDDMDYIITIQHKDNHAGTAVFRIPTGSFSRDDFQRLADAARGGTPAFVSADMLTIYVQPPYITFFSNTFQMTYLGEWFMGVFMQIADELSDMSADELDLSLSGEQSIGDTDDADQW